MALRVMNADFFPTRTESPSLENVEVAIRALNGKDRTLVTLEIDADHHMGIGGGGGRYVIYCTRDNLRFKNLVVPGKTGAKEVLTCGGQEGDFEANQCVDLAVAMQAAKFFAETGQPDPALHWEDG